MSDLTLMDQEVQGIRQDSSPCECMPNTPPDLPVWRKCFPCREEVLLKAYAEALGRWQALHNEVGCTGDEAACPCKDDTDGA